MLRQHLSTLTIQTPGRDLPEITSEIRSRVPESRIQQGLLTLFVRHTSASLLVQENADPDQKLQTRTAVLECCQASGACRAVSAAFASAAS